MALAFPDARGLFSHIQEALRHVNDKRFMLKQGFHAALSDFRWMAEDLENRPTQLYEIVPLSPTMYDYHKTSGAMCGGVPTNGPHRCAYVNSSTD